MSASFAYLTDADFVSLLGESPLAFSARLRAQAMARQLKDRVAAVSTDLRHWIVAGEVADPVLVARIASNFDHLASQMETEIGRTDTTRWLDAPQESANDNRYLRQFRPDHYEIEAWHAPAN